MTTAANKLQGFEYMRYVIRRFVVPNLLIISAVLINGLPGTVKAQLLHADSLCFDYREKVFLHTDRELYLTGEFIRFSAWCVSWPTNRPSGTSKILYVELLNNQANSVIREKIRLDDGGAGGYLEIPRSFHTGVYFVRAYTRWMTNLDPSWYFMKKLYIVNPFLPVETSRTDTFGHRALALPGTGESSTDRYKESPPVGNKELTIGINLGKDKYAAREQVILRMNVTDPAGHPSSGRFSVSVCKICSHPYLKTLNICRYLHDSLWMVQPEVPAGIPRMLPEIRGLTLTGMVYDRLRQEPVAKVPVYAALPGKVAKLYTGITGKDGRFCIQLSDLEGDRDIVVMAAADPEKYSVTLDNPFTDKYTGLKNELFYPGEDLIRYISQLMVNLQIEDAYGKLAKGQNPGNIDDSQAFYGVPDETVIMDDYIKLPALEEVFFEIVKSVGITRKRDQYELTITDPRTLQPVAGKPLLMLDGVPVTDINPVISQLDPEEIERIDIISSRYVLGDISSSGIINLITHDAGYHQFELPAYVQRQSYQFLQVPVPFNSPDYSFSPDSLRSVPDYRNTLYWNPDIRTDATGKAEIKFYTADDLSGYRIVIQGINADGIPGYAESYICTKQ